MRAKEKDIVLIVEKSTIDLKELIKKSLSEMVSINVTKIEAEKIINQTYDELNKYDGYQEYALNVKTSLYRNFTDWYESATNVITSISDTNEFASKVLTQIKQINLDYGDDKKAKVKGTFVFTGSDGFVFNNSSNNLNQFMTSGETGYSQMLIKDYTLKVNDSMKELALSKPILKDRLGRNMSLRNLAEMTVRYNQRNEILNDLKGSGVNLVMISQHTNASKRCAKWQGKVYSLDNSSGITNDKNHYHYEPLANATSNHQLFGYNCRHRAFAYIENMDKPKPIPAEQIKKEREIENTQRYLERSIIDLRSKKKLLIEDSEKKKYSGLIKKSVETYKTFCKKNDVVIENWRTEI